VVGKRSDRAERSRIDIRAGIRQAHRRPERFLDSFFDGGNQIFHLDR